jgi:hypothetical protein
MDIKDLLSKDTKEVTLEKSQIIFELFYNLLDKLKTRQIIHSEKLILIEESDIFAVTCEDMSVEFFRKCKFLSEKEVQESFVSIYTISDEKNITSHDTWIWISNIQLTNKFESQFSLGINYNKIEFYSYLLQIENQKIINLKLKREFDSETE